MASAQQMILTVAAMHGLGMHRGAWIARDGDVTDYLSPAMYIEMARIAEAGKLHAIFLADGITNADEGTDRPADTLDTVTALALMAAVTSRIGLVGTASTTYNQPYDLARRFATLDHLSRGRAGWNSVTTHIPAAAAMFGTGEHPDHVDRYARADEFIDVAMRLWASWEEGALIGDKATGVFADATKVHPIDHRGALFSVRGPLPFPRTPQGRPVVFQAGSSPQGRDQAAKYANVVFTALHLIEGAVAFRSDMRARTAAYGRDPDGIKILPGMSCVLGATEADAVARHRRLVDSLGTGPELANLARRVGVPVEALDLDKPFPLHLLGPDEEFSGSIGFRQTFVSLAKKENTTVRGLIARYGGGHQQVIGTPGKIADVMQAWLAAGAADGFNIMVDMLPSGIEQVVELLVPELQARGIFHRDYSHATFRENLGLDRPELPAGARAAHSDMAFA